MEGAGGWEQVSEGHVWWKQKNKIKWNKCCKKWLSYLKSRVHVYVYDFFSKERAQWTSFCSRVESRRRRGSGSDKLRVYTWSLFNWIWASYALPRPQFPHLWRSDLRRLSQMGLVQRSSLWRGVGKLQGLALATGGVMAGQPGKTQRTSQGQILLHCWVMRNLISKSPFFWCTCTGQIIRCFKRADANI